MFPPMCIRAETVTKTIKPKMQPTDHMTVVASLPCGHHKTHSYDVTGMMCVFDVKQSPQYRSAARWHGARLACSCTKPPSEFVRESFIMFAQSA